MPSHTVTQACISANQAICSGINLIQTGQAEVVIAGGVETMSDVPIKFSKPLRERMLATRKTKGLAKQLGLLKGLKLADLAPEAPSIKNFITGEVMGHSSDRLADAFGVTRRESDEFAMRSHHNAAKAHADGLYDEEVLEYNGKRTEEGVRGESSMEKLSSLKPAFVKPYGTVTAANASYLTDGAAATLIMSEEKAKELGYTPKAYLREWTFVSCDPFDQMLLGPAYATNKVRLSHLCAPAAHLATPMPECALPPSDAGSRHGEDEAGRLWCHRVPRSLRRPGPRQRQRAQLAEILR